VSDFAARVQHLRSLSGLNTETLAQIFGVSRQMVQGWTAGAVPHQQRLQHVLAVIALIDEAARRFPDPAALRLWLLSPVSPGGTDPINLLREKRYDTFRGFVLHKSTER
jgi:transcriptional regulator with XRE-family HTH domain